MGLGNQMLLIERSTHPEVPGPFFVIMFKMSSLPLVLAILASIFVLVKSADWVIDSIRNLGNSSGVSRFKMAVIFLGLATSLPELILGIMSAASGVPTLSLGNVIGANIADISLVLGAAGLFGGILYFHYAKDITKEISFAFLVAVAPIILLWDRGLSRADGLILVGLYLFYVSGFLDKILGRSGGGKGSGRPGDRGFWRVLFGNILSGNNGARKQLLKLALGAVVLGLSARLVVGFSQDLSQTFGVPLFLVGLLALSIGTTLPELVVAYRAVKKKEDVSFLGNALGSVIANSTLIIGIVVLISPLTIVARREYALSVLMLIVSFALLWFFVRKERELNRLEAGVLLLTYSVFVGLELSGFNPLAFLLK